VSSGAALSLPDGLFAPHELVRELGARPNPVYVVRQASAATNSKAVLAVAERFAGVAKTPAGEELTREARRIATLASPNLARVREVVVRGDDLVVVGEFVEGEKLHELWRPEKLPLEIALRIIVDALAGLGALHNLRDAKQQPMKLAHGEASPATIVFGLDGIARVLHAVSRRAPGARPEPASHGYLAPEAATGDAYDARADVFSAGVMLWEALSGKRLFAEGAAPAANAKRVRSGALPPPTVPEKAAWAKSLVGVVTKALSAAPDDRWPTAAVMAAEVRKAAGLKLAPASTAASFARSAFGEGVKTRRESLDGGFRSSRPPKPPPAVAPDELPTLPPSPPLEPSFVEVELDPAVDTVLVAPGIRANVEEVVELESESLIEAASDRPPPPAAPAPAGFVLDPFAAGGVASGLSGGARPAPSPALAAPTAPVAVVQATRPAEPPPPPSLTGAPHFAAAIDLPPPGFAATPEHVAMSFPASPPLEVEADEMDPRSPGARRRKLIVLGGVGALGLVVFLLAAVRIATREPDATPAAALPPVTTASAVMPTVSPPPVAKPAAVPGAVSPTAAAPAAVAATPAAVTKRPAATATPKPTPVVAAAPAHAAPAAHPTGGTKPRPKPTFDPNSL
jgi:hypothetical protein